MPKTTFFTIRKQQTLNFSYHESSRGQSSQENQRGLKAFRTDNLPRWSVGRPWIHSYQAICYFWPLGETPTLKPLLTLSRLRLKGYISITHDDCCPCQFIFIFYCFVVMEKTVTFVPGSNQTCQICEAVMTYVKNLLADNATQVPC